VAKSSKPKVPVSVGFALDKKSADKVSKSGVRALDQVGQIFVKSGSKFLARPDGGGYESRLWEKVTCDILGGLVPEDLVTNPEQFGIKVTKAKVAAKKTSKRTR
jgi:hypothetical protein